MEIVVVPSLPILGVTRNGRVMNMVSGKWLSICDNGHGYKQVFVCVNNKRYMRYVHRLVAECFVDNPHGLCEINHKDGDKSNNAAQNLEWCTRAENLRHAYRTGLRQTTEKQIEASRKSGKENIHFARAGWKAWAQTETAMEQWKKNLEKADRWGTRNEPAEVKANRRREHKRLYRQKNREELNRKARERYAKKVAQRN